MENLNYYYVLSASYGSALLLWWMIQRFILPIWNRQEGPVSSKNPWAQVGWVLLAAVLTILIGRVYSAGYLVPEFTIGTVRVAESCNQLLIYSPFVLYLVFWKQPLSTAWIPTSKIGVRLIIGLLLGIMAAGIFVLLSHRRDVFSVFADVYHPKNIHHAIQVFLEDFAIALLLSRLLVAMGPRRFIIAVLIVSFLFSFGHLPAALEQGQTLLSAMVQALLDMAVVFGIAFFLQKSRDILWFWPIHFAMDMMQFYSGLLISQILY